ncbi:Putative protein of unknown function [Podospora comata]|uniref:DUF1308 domain-containing protein n=1 Tax=Podospora comata TaxID=48703 RepID=A0ABY6SJ45_PODCO|nr:Putative protein of unknown function [Podospora comata]
MATGETTIAQLSPSEPNDSSTSLPIRTKPNAKIAEMEPGPELDSYIESLLAQWRTCIDELSTLANASKDASRPIYGLYPLLKVQQRALYKVVQKRNTKSDNGNNISAAQYMGIRSCCWDDRWSLVKKCHGLVAINKDFPRSPRVAVPTGSGWLAYKDQPFQEKVVTVDAVVDNGKTWIKFLSISARTLEYQVMAEGWESDADSEDERDEAGDDEGNGLGHTEFVDAVSKVILAARWNHCRHLHLILPGLQEGQSAVIDRVLDHIKNKVGGTDVKVDLSCAGSPFLINDSPPLETAIQTLIHERDLVVSPDDCNTITETVNLDPSALVALVTDLHHGPITLQPLVQQEIITRSVADHETDNNELVSRQDILATVLYPALRGKKLVCTEFAAKYFRKLISAISTHSEETRASFIIPPSADPTSPPPSADELRQSLQKWSTVPVPGDLQLPVQVVPDITHDEVPSLISSGRLPPMALGVSSDLSLLNRSVYLYGWANDVTTVTGHRGIERQVQLSIASHWTRDLDASRKGKYPDQRPPDIWHRHLGGYLIHRDKPKDWRDMLPDGGDVPEEVVRWTFPWTTWGRGISTYGLPDTKTWEGVGHEDKKSFGRKMTGRDGTRERNGNGKLKVPEGEVEEGEEREEEQS